MTTEERTYALVDFKIEVRAGVTNNDKASEAALDALDGTQEIEQTLEILADRIKEICSEHLVGVTVTVKS